LSSSCLTDYWCNGVIIVAVYLFSLIATLNWRCHLV
jgi:hypothetical protein